MLHRYLRDFIMCEAAVFMVAFPIGLEFTLKNLVLYALMFTAWSILMACVTLIGGKNDTR